MGVVDYLDDPHTPEQQNIFCIMATWTTLQISDLNDYLAANQVQALQTIALANDQGNPINEIIDDITARIRAEISGNHNNILSTNKTEIPYELKSCACYLILEAAQTRLTGLQLSNDQIRMANESREYLKRIAQGEIPISLPDNAQLISDFTNNSVCEVVHHRVPLATSHSLRGF